ncbi:response regulator transcription factor [Nocardia sp. NPDC020380]|uniref:response regulator transcription factor n=1 Tax=Nocardia sp. NPDC020380 TaxID=3364309 RepID=UPI00379D503C
MPDDDSSSRDIWVLVCEDDEALGKRVADGLRDAGFTVHLTRSLAQAREQTGAHDYDCLVLDRGLPDGDGLELVRRQRESGQSTPVLIMTARDNPRDRAEGYAGGVNDYLTKPFSLRELATRVRTLCGTRARAHGPVITIGDLVVDRLRRRVQRSGILLTLTGREFCALELLAAHAGSVVTPAEFAVYCDDSGGIDDVITRVDRKLGDPSMIHASPAGYLLHTGELSGSRAG